MNRRAGVLTDGLHSQTSFVWYISGKFEIHAKIPNYAVPDVPFSVRVVPFIQVFVATNLASTFSVFR